MLVKHNLKINWRFQTRPNIMPDLETLKKAKNHGCKVVGMGIEGGNEKILQINQTTSKKDIIAAVGRVKAAGLKAYAGFIIGFPEDTIETVWDTIRFPDELNIDSLGSPTYGALSLLQQFEKS